MEIPSVNSQPYVHCLRSSPGVEKPPRVSVMELGKTNIIVYKQRVLMHRHQGLNVRHGLCHIYMRYLYIYMSCLQLLFVLLFVHNCNVMVYVVHCVASGKQEKVQACLVTLWLFIRSCHSLYKTTLGSLCS